MANQAKIMDTLYGSEPLVIEANGSVLMNLLNWYNATAEPEDRRKWIVKYAKERLQYSDQDVSFLQSAALQLVPTVPHCARAILHGSTFVDQIKIIKFIDEACKIAVEKARKEYDQNQNERVQLKQREMLARKTVLTNAYWNIYDQLEMSSKPLVLQVLEDLNPVEIEQIKKHLQFTLSEYQEAKHDSEGYESVNVKSQIKRIETALQSMDYRNDVKKAQKKTTIIRKRKPVTAAKQVSKMRYAKEVEGFKSMNPEAILTSSLLFVYEDKTRKLIRFSNPDGQRMTVAGVKIKAQAITSKTVRKPSSVLTEMRKGTMKMAERVYSELKTKEQSHSGRMTDKSLILRMNTV